MTPAQPGSGDELPVSTGFSAFAVEVYCRQSLTLVRYALLAVPKMATEEDLYSWLGTDSRGNPYHLHLLNHVWSEDGVEHDLRVYHSVAERLGTEPKFWAVILRGAYGWRPTLVGCACLLLAKERGFFQELTECFELGSMVRPQVAVTLGLLHPVEARSFFEAFLDIPEFCTSALAVVAAQRTLCLLGAFAECDVQLTGWPIAEQDSATLANDVVKRHWSFWCPRI